MSEEVVVDASLATTWAIPERDSRRALSLAEQWASEVRRLLAPSLILAETNNAVYKRVVRREMSLEDAQSALKIILGFNFEIREESGLQTRAMELAHQLQQPTTYDCQYLALAEFYDCALWTGDRRFYGSAGELFRRVKWIGNYNP